MYISNFVYLEINKYNLYRIYNNINNNMIKNDIYTQRYLQKCLKIEE